VAILPRTDYAQNRARSAAAKAARASVLQDIRANPGPCLVGPPLSRAPLPVWAARTGRQSLVSRLSPPPDLASGGPPQAASGAASAGLDSIGTSGTAKREIPRKRLRRMRRAVLTAARLLQEEATQGGERFKVAMVTLTYGAAAPAANDVADCIRHIRQWLGRRGARCRIVWVAENQPISGRLHYHLLVWLPKGLTLPKPDTQGWWSKGWSNIKWARKAVGYLAKYASKGGQGEIWQLPKGSRICGYSGVHGTARDVLRWHLAPHWLRDLVACGNSLRRAGCWWEDRSTRIAYRSPYDLVDRVGDLLTFTGPHWDDSRVRFL